MTKCYWSVEMVDGSVEKIYAESASEAVRIAISHGKRPNRVRKA